jgi:hypothetical protein
MGESVLGFGSFYCHKERFTVTRNILLSVHRHWYLLWVVIIYQILINVVKIVGSLSLNKGIHA